MRHTPGPWKFEVRNYQAMVTTERDDIDMVVASNLFDEELDLELDEVEANARLIASAPDLLEALQELIDWEGVERNAFPLNNNYNLCPCRNDEITQKKAHEVWTTVFKAIAKATGK